MLATGFKTSASCSTGIFTSSSSNTGLLADPNQNFSTTSPSNALTLPQDNLEDQFCAHLIAKGKMNTRLDWTNQWSQTVNAFGKNEVHADFIERLNNAILPMQTLQGTNKAFFSQFDLVTLFNALERVLAPAGIEIENIQLIGSAVAWCFYPYLPTIAKDLEIEETSPLYKHLSSILLKDFSDIDWRITLKKLPHYTLAQIKNAIQLALDTVVSLIGFYCRPQPCSGAFIRQNQGLANYMICVDEKPPAPGQRTNQFGIVSYVPVGGKKVDIAIGYSFKTLHYATQDAAHLTLKPLINNPNAGFIEILDRSKFLPALVHRFGKIIHLPNTVDLDPFSAFPLLLSYHVKGYRSSSFEQVFALLDHFLNKAEVIAKQHQNEKSETKEGQKSPNEWYKKVLDRSSHNPATPAWIPILIEGMKKAAFVHNGYNPAAYFFMVLQLMPLLHQNRRSKEQSSLFFTTAVEGLTTKRTGEPVPPRDQISSPLVKALVDCACAEPENYEAMLSTLRLLSFLYLCTKEANSTTRDREFYVSLTSHNQTPHIKFSVGQVHLFLSTDIPQALSQLSKSATKGVETLVATLRKALLSSYDFQKDSPIGKYRHLIPSSHLQTTDCALSSPHTNGLKQLVELALMALGGPSIKSIPDLVKIGTDPEQQLQLLNTCLHSPHQEESGTELLLHLKEQILKSPTTPIDHLLILSHASFPNHCHKALELWKNNRTQPLPENLTDFDQAVFDQLKETRPDLGLQMCIELHSPVIPLQRYMEVVNSLVVQPSTQPHLNPVWCRHWNRLFEMLFARLTKHSEERLPIGTIEQFKNIAQGLEQSKQQQAIENLLPLAQKAFLNQEDHPQIEAFWIAKIQLFLTANSYDIVEKLLKSAQILKIFEEVKSVEYQKLVLDLLALRQKCPTSIELALTIQFDKDHAPLAYATLSDHAQKIGKISEEQVDFVLRFFKSHAFVTTAIQQQTQTRSCFVDLTQKMKENPVFKKYIQAIFHQLSSQTVPIQDVYYAYLHTTGYMKNGINPKIHVPKNRFLFTALIQQDFHQEALDLWEQMRSHLQSITLNDLEQLLQALKKAPNIRLYREWIQLFAKLIQEKDRKEWEPLLDALLANAPPELVSEVLALVSTASSVKPVPQKKATPQLSQDILRGKLETYYVRVHTNINNENKIACIARALNFIDTSTPKPSILFWIQTMVPFIQASPALVDLVISKQDWLFSPLESHPELSQLFFNVLSACVQKGGLKGEHADAFFPHFIKLIENTQNDPAFISKASTFFNALEAKKLLNKITDENRIEMISSLIDQSSHDHLPRLIEAFIQGVDKIANGWESRGVQKRCQDWMQKNQNALTPWLTLFKKCDPWADEGWKTEATGKMIHALVREDFKQTLVFRLRLINLFWDPLLKCTEHELLAKTLHSLIRETDVSQEEATTLVEKLALLDNTLATIWKEVFESLLQRFKQAKPAGVSSSSSKTQKAAQLSPLQKAPPEKRYFIFNLTWRHLLRKQRLRKDNPNAIAKLLHFTLDAIQPEHKIGDEELRFFASHITDLCAYIKILKADDQVEIINRLLWLISAALSKQPPEDMETRSIWDSITAGIKKEVNVTKPTPKQVSIETTIRKISIILLLRQGKHQEGLAMIVPGDILMECPLENLSATEEMTQLAAEIEALFQELSPPIRSVYFANRFARISQLIRTCQAIYSSRNKPVLSESLFKAFSQRIAAAIPVSEYLDLLHLMFEQTPLTFQGIVLLQVLDIPTLDTEILKKLPGVIASIQGEHVEIDKMHILYLKFGPSVPIDAWKKPFLRNLDAKHTALTQELHRIIPLAIKKPQDLKKHPAMLDKIIQQHEDLVRAHLNAIENTLPLFVGIRDIEKTLLGYYLETLTLFKAGLPLLKFACHLTDLAQSLAKSINTPTTTPPENRALILQLFNTLTAKICEYTYDPDLNENSRSIVCTTIYCLLKIFKDPYFIKADTSEKLLGFCTHLFSFYTEASAKDMSNLISFLSTHPIAQYIPKTWKPNQIYLCAHIAPTASLPLATFTPQEINQFNDLFFNSLEPIKGMDLKSYLLPLQYLALVDCTAPFSRHPHDHPFHQTQFVKNKLLSILSHDTLYIARWVKFFLLFYQCKSSSMTVQNLNNIRYAIEGLFNPTILSQLETGDREKWKELMSQLIRVIYNDQYLVALLKMKQLDSFNALKNQIAIPPPQTFDYLTPNARQAAQKILGLAEKTVNTDLPK